MSNFREKSLKVLELITKLQCDIIMSLPNFSGIFAEKSVANLFKLMPSEGQTSYFQKLNPQLTRGDGLHILLKQQKIIHLVLQNVRPTFWH